MRHVLFFTIGTLLIAACTHDRGKTGSFAVDAAGFVDPDLPSSDGGAIDGGAPAAAPCHIANLEAAGQMPYVDRQVAYRMYRTSDDALNFVLEDQASDGGLSARLVRFDHAGLQLSTQALGGSPSLASAYIDSAVFDGDQLAVFYVDPSALTQRVNLYTPDGTLVANQVSVPASNAVYSTGTIYAVAGGDPAAIATLAHTGATLSAPATVSTTYLITSIASSGSELAVLLAYSQFARSGAFFARVGLDGSVLTPIPLVINDDTTGGCTHPAPQLVWTGNAYVAAYYDSTIPALVLQRIAPNGDLIGPEVPYSLPTTAVNGDLEFALAWSGSDLGVVWKEALGSTKTDAEYYFQRYTADLVPLASALQVTHIGGTTDQRFPQLVWMGDEYVFSFYGKVGGQGPNVFFASVCD